VGAAAVRCIVLIQMEDGRYHAIDGEVKDVLVDRSHGTIHFGRGLNLPPQFDTRVDITFDGQPAAYWANPEAMCRQAKHNPRQLGGGA
jgi:hypothetical protein